MNADQVSREAAERWHRFNLVYPELAERALHETIEGAIKVCVPVAPHLIKRVEIAILANGGGDYDAMACECDASVNQCPCRYCAIRDALNETLRYLKSYENQRPNRTSRRVHF